MLWRTNGGAGLSLRPWPGALAYAMLEGTFDVSGKLRSDYALGVGSSFGLLVGDAGDRWRGHLRAEAMRFLMGDTRTFLGIGFDQRLRLTRSHGLELKLGVQRDFHQTWLEAGLYWHVYF
jgi:hypothetical protein